MSRTDPEPPVIEFRAPPPTGFELRWRMFGIQFRVLPSFFLIAGVLAYILVGFNLVFIAVDIGCVLAAILFTELVQGIVYRSFGLRSTVLIQEFGGGIYPEHAPPLAIQRITAALSNPASSFLLYFVLQYSNEHLNWAHPREWTGVAYQILRIISLFWGVIGCLPMLPYPGGRVLMELLGFLSPRYGLEATIWFSIIVGLMLIADTVWLLLGHPSQLPYLNQLGQNTRVLIGVFFVLALLRNWQLLQYARGMRRGYQEPVDDYGDHAPWER